MPIDVTTPQGPGWWLKRCADKHLPVLKRIDPLYARYEGNAPLPASLRDAPEAARRFFKTARTNYAEMIVRAPRYRLNVGAILTAGSTDELGDDEAMRLWRDSGAATEQDDVHRNALICGSGYMLAAKYKGEVAATSEDPRQVVTIHDPVRQSLILAAAKFYHDDVRDRDVAYLFRPEEPEGSDEPATTGRRWVAFRNRRSTSKAPARFSGASWQWDPDLGGEDGEAVPVPMPIVRYRNEESVGEFERHLDLLDRIDHVILQGMVIATLQAFRQRAIKVEDKDLPDHDPETGEKIDYNAIFTADPAALWKLPKSAELWESGAVDPSLVYNLADKDAQRLSGVTFTPMSMFTPDAANQSAAGASLVKDGLTTKVRDKQTRHGESHAQLVALLGTIADKPGLTDASTITIRWDPADRPSLAERADAASKAKASEVPWRTRMREIWQFDPQQVQRMEAERMDDQVLAAQLVAQAQAPDAAAQQG